MMRFLQSCVYSLDIMIYFRGKSNNEKLRKILSIILIPAGIVRYIYASIKAMFINTKSEKCAVVLIIKNEGKYIKEYVEYYTALDCDLIIYDNDSDDGTASIVKKYRNVTYIPWHGKKRQIDAYNQACKKYEKKYKYIMFFDADEFLIADDLLKGKSLYQILDSVFKRQKKTACLGINWLIFGSSNLVEDPEDGVINAFTHCARDEFEWNQLVKSCVIPSKIVGWVNPHLPLQTFGYKKINLDGKKIVQPRNELPKKKKIRLYHYFVKNKKHFEEKVNKGMADRNANDVINYKAISVRDYILKK